MKPQIDKTTFGSITVDGETYDHDIVIRLSGKVQKRKKKLSKERYGTSHTVSAEDASRGETGGRPGRVVTQQEIFCSLL